jgi:hypothetical protein
MRDFLIPERGKRMNARMGLPLSARWVLSRYPLNLLSTAQSWKRNPVEKRDIEDSDPRAVKNCGTRLPPSADAGTSAGIILIQ